MTVHPPPTKGWARFTASAAAWWTRFTTYLPMRLALTAVTAVWALGAVWSFTEQRAFAGAKTFTDPALLPLVLDGFAIAMACVAFAASLDGRPAIPARLATVIGVIASAASNGVWAAQRSNAPHGPDMTTVAIGVGIPVFANVAFEVLLAELRRQVQRKRGMPAPVAIPSLRLIRLVLAPRSTFKAWRDEVLARTAQTHLDPPQWGPPSTVDEPPTQAPTTPVLEAPTEPVDEEDTGELAIVPAPPVLHLMRPVDTPALPASTEPEPASTPESTDPLRVPGAKRTWRQAKDLAKELGVTRRSDWGVGDLNDALDKHLQAQAS